MLGMNGLRGPARRFGRLPATGGHVIDTPPSMLTT